MAACLYFLIGRVYTRLIITMNKSYKCKRSAAIMLLAYVLMYHILFYLFLLSGYVPSLFPTVADLVLLIPTPAARI